MTRRCGRWIITALVLLSVDWHVLHSDVMGSVPGRVAHLLLLAALGACAARTFGRRGPALALCAWWSAGLQWHLAFVPGHEVGATVWLLDVLAAVPGVWWAARRAHARPARTPDVRPVAVLSELGR